MKSGFLCAATLLLILAGCGPSPEQKAEAKKTQEGREDTRNIRNTEAIGLPGAAIGGKLDHALDANDKHNKDMQDADPNAADRPAGQ